MEKSAKLDEIKNYIEGSDQKHECTVSIPKYVSITVETFLNDLLSKTQKDASQITPKDIAEIIENTPEYKFLLPVAEKISNP